MRVLTHADCRKHLEAAEGVEVAYPECPRRLAGILRELDAAGLAPRAVEAHGRAEAAVEAVHDGAYVARFRRAVERGDGLLDSADNPLSPGTWQAAWGAVSASLAAADIAAEAGGRAFAAVRPPGHHAEHGVAMGFCYLNNAAVAGDYLLRERGAERVAIFDFDVHHGNGTQHLFEERADVLYASTHQYPFYPGTGAADEVGRGPGEGTTLNVPLPAGTGDEAFLAACTETVLPALARFRPDVLIVSAGFDAWKEDPLGGFAVGVDSFRTLGTLLGELADEVCGGRLLSLLEGGYDLKMLPTLVRSYLEGAAG
jgi:acetoin utilization deacetylase AcuC-like enzyme